MSPNSRLVRSLCGALAAILASGCDAEAPVLQHGKGAIFGDSADASRDGGKPQAPAHGDASSGAKGKPSGDAAAPGNDAGVADDADGSVASDAGASVVLPPPPKPRKYNGAIVVNGDYASISISVVSTQAKVLSEVFLSAASADAKLTVPLSGDVILPNSDTFGDEVVVIDRSNAVLTFVDLKTAVVRAQLDVGPGFDANPHDYVRVADDKAYVARFADNGDPGKEKFDSGLDLLIIDPSKPKIVGSVDLRSVMAKNEMFPATPDRMVAAGGRVHVMISGLAADFSDIAEARIVSVDVASDEIVQVLRLKGMRNCTDIALSPDQRTLAVGCTGLFGQDPKNNWPDAGVVLVSVGDELAETSRFDSNEFQSCQGTNCQNAQVNGVSFASNQLLLVTTFGASGAGPLKDVSYPAMVVELNSESRKTRVLLEGGAFDLGGPACFSTACLVPNAPYGGPAGLLKFEVANGAFGAGKLTPVDQTTMLPPRHVQRF